MAQWTVRGNIIREMGDGIAIGFFFADAVIENNLIANNTRHGIFNLRGIVIIRNNTIVVNGLVGYREEFGPPANSIFVNNIVAFNGTAMTAADTRPAGFVAASPDYYIAFNNLFGNANGDFYGDDCRADPRTPSPGTGEISVDPMFRDPANGDYRLAPGSPSIDAGTNDNAPATDLDGHMRPIDGNGDGTAVADMGAFESEEVSDPTPPVVTAAAEARLRSHRLVTDGCPSWYGVWSETNRAWTWRAGRLPSPTNTGIVEPHGSFTIGEDGRYSFVVGSRRGAAETIAMAGDT